MGDAILGLLLLLAALLFAFPKTRPIWWLLWWLLWWRLRKVLILAVIIGALVAFAGHGTDLT